MVEDFCAECVEPTPELSVSKQAATLALKKSERKRAVFGLLIRVVPPDKHLVPFGDQVLILLWNPLEIEKCTFGYN